MNGGLETLRMCPLLFPIYWRNCLYKFPSRKTIFQTNRNVIQQVCRLLYAYIQHNISLVNYE